MFDTTSANSSTSRLPDHEEAAAVAEAIGQSSSSVMDLHEARSSKRSSREYTSSQASDNADTESIGQRSVSSAPPHSATPSLDLSSSAAVVLTSPGLPDEDSPAVSEGGGDHADFTDDSSRITPMSTMVSETSSGFDDHIRALAPGPGLGPEVHVSSPSETKDIG